MAESPNIRVSTLELFFDLVFVFVITQLAETLHGDMSLRSLGNVVLILLVVWWMYSGYAWLTNAVAPNSTTRRTLLLTGMAGFLVMALAIPDAFGKQGWLFGVSYVVVNAVHAVLFSLGGPGARQAMRLLTPINLTAAGLVLAGSLVPEPWRHVCWIAAPVIQIAGGYLHRIEMHSIAAGHFTERHGLVIIIAIGESVVSIGVGLHAHLDLSAVLVAILGLTISYYLWWFYFAGDDARSERVLAGVKEPYARARLALNGWGYAHFPMLLGIVVLAVGVKESVADSFHHLELGTASALAGGVALYLLGHAWFLALLGLRGVIHRVAGAAVVLATIPLGMRMGIIELAAIPIIMITTAIIEDLPEVRRLGPAALGDFGRTAHHE